MSEEKNHQPRWRRRGVRKRRLGAGSSGQTPQSSFCPASPCPWGSVTSGGSPSRHTRTAAVGKYFLVYIKYSIQKYFEAPSWFPTWLCCCWWGGRCTCWSSAWASSAAEAVSRWSNIATCIKNIKWKIFEVWELSPALRGVGYGQVLASACVVSYYCSLIGEFI